MSEREPLKVLGMPSGVALTADQARRVTVLTYVYTLRPTLDVSWALKIARWIETGEVKP